MLEESKTQQEYAIRDQWEEVKYQYRPANIIRTAFGKLVSDGANPTIILTGLGLGLGFLIRRWVAGKFPNFWGRWAALALQVGISALLAKKDSSNKTVNFLKKTFAKKKKPGLLPG
jgi:hypothetical protein